MLAFITPDTGEVDTEDDFKRLNYLLANGKFGIYEYLCKNFEDLKSE
jgi:hypothetical protein